MTASVAIAKDTQLIAEYSVNYKKTHSQTLLPMLDEICREVCLSLDEVDAIAVSSGPGSFTGLRIGSATAKGIALAIDKPLIHVPTLEALSYNAWGMPGLVAAMMDARRQQVYAAVYRFEEGTACPALKQEKASCLTKEDPTGPALSMEAVCVVPAGAMALEELTGRLNDLGEPVFLLGDGSSVFSEKLNGLLTVPHRFAPPHMNAQRAGCVAVCAFSCARRDGFENPDLHAPDYFGLSQAERVRSEQLAMSAKS